MKSIKISIIIVNYKVKKELFACIASIYNSKPKTSFEIIVVNNDEQESIKKEILKLFPGITYIKSPSNLGYGGGNNLGTKSAKGKYLFFLNPDTVVFKDAIDVLVNFLDNNSKAGIVAPLLLDKNNRPYEFQGNLELTPLRGIVVLSFLSKVFPKTFNKYWMTDLNKNEIKEAYSIPGTAFVIRKDIFEKVGKFDENFFLYFEEHDICKRVKNEGYGIFIDSKAKIFHEWGVSTKHIVEINKIFEKSRYLYFKKHYGIFKALLVESILRINKTFFVIVFALLLALLLRIYNLSQGMVFIGDQGWFYLSARDLLIHGKIPLVGITSSHTWLHQGPLWTYMLSVALLVSRFNPLSGAYLTAIFGVLTTFLMYKLGSSMFSVRVGVVAALLYAASPLIVFFDRMPFDPSPIPFFTVLYFFSIFKWLKGNINYFPLIILFIALLYNLELATFTLFFPFALLMLYGFVKHKIYVKDLINRKTIQYSLIALIVPMLPVIIYDFSNGFKQTIVFLGWTIYKPFSFLIKHSSGNFVSNIGVVLGFISTNVQKLVFQFSLPIAISLFVLSLIFLIYSLSKHKKIEIGNSKFILFFLLIVSFGGILVNQTPSDAYLPIIFPFVIFSIALLFDFLLQLKIIKYFAIILFVLIIILNSYQSIKNSYANDLKERENAVGKIISITNNQEYNLEGSGPGSQFKSFTMNYEYLLWWKGHPPTAKNAKLKIVVSETKNGIIIRKND
jgi:GT2 family glycosyltransferase/4-amino-4-deoxy-L-arabinose transferase-like glycosyltransferase